MFTTNVKGRSNREEAKGRYRRRLRRPSVGAAIALVALLALGGIGYAAIPSQGGTFRACYAKTEGLLLGIPHSKGDLRLVNEGEACRSYETLTTWNQQGVPGTPGTPGTNGTNGTNGVSDYSVLTKYSGISTFGQASLLAACPTGTYVLSGTYRGETPNGGEILLDNVWSQIRDLTQFQVIVDSANLVGSRLVAQVVCAKAS